jgi:outer membrane protein assembly factor BamB
VIYGSHSRYNYAQGHLLRYSSTGQFRHAYAFGWDVTPAIYKHGSTYSIITKENRYNVGSYCADSACPSDRNTSNPGDPEAYYITQLSPSLHVEWQYKNTNTLTCTRNPDNSISCVNDKPFSFEWCINGVAVDKNGVVYANAEDGDLYAINQGGTLRKKLFMKLGVRSAYTPTTLGADGKIYTQQNGELFVLGN